MNVASLVTGIILVIVGFVIIVFAITIIIVKDIIFSILQEDIPVPWYVWLMIALSSVFIIIGIILVSISFFVGEGKHGKAIISTQEKEVSSY